MFFRTVLGITLINLTDVRGLGLWRTDANIKALAKPVVDRRVQWSTGDFDSAVDPTSRYDMYADVISLAPATGAGVKHCLSRADDFFIRAVDQLDIVSPPTFRFGEELD